MNVITVDFVGAIEVQFLDQIFEDDFPERGMVAWLTLVEWEPKDDCYKLYFDFTDFENINDKYFRESYYENKNTRLLGIEKPLYTAKEAGMYSPKYSVFFSIPGDMQNDKLFEENIKKVLRVVV